jgi:hypothetical protein
MAAYKLPAPCHRRRANRGLYLASRYSGRRRRARSGLAVGPFTGADAGHQYYLASLLLLVGYYWLWWRKNVIAAGLKMPPVTPLFSLPAAMSPGYLRFITQRKYDDVAFSSDLLGLVAKRAIRLTSKKAKPKARGLHPLLMSSGFPVSQTKNISR